MRLFTHAESGQVTYTPLSLDITKHSRCILSTMLYTQKKNTPQRSTYLSHFWMVFIIYNAFFAVANFTTILKVISDCLMLQNTEKRSIFLHAYIQTVKKPRIF